MLKFIYDYYLNLMNSRQKLELISSVDCSYSGIFLISILMYAVIQFSRTQLYVEISKENKILKNKILGLVTLINGYDLYIISTNYVNICLCLLKRD